MALQGALNRQPLQTALPTQQACRCRAKQRAAAPTYCILRQDPSSSPARQAAALLGVLGGAVSLAASSPAKAADLISTVADAGSIPWAVGGFGAIAALGTALVVTDPSNRRSQQAQASGGDEMASVKKYFNTEGFQRWNKIYGETDEVNKVQLDIRTGHAQTVGKVLNWLDEEGGVTGTTVCDAGCGTGSLAIPLALRGAAVSASDISEAMANEARRRYEATVAKGVQAPSTPPKFEALDLESVSGKYHTVTCLDVMIHYPQDKVNGMIEHLSSLAEERLIISFAPKTLAYSILKRVGELFPGPSKATRAYLHAEADVEAALNKAGWKVTKREMTATQFYFSRLLEATRA